MPEEFVVADNLDISWSNFDPYPLPADNPFHVERDDKPLDRLKKALLLEHKQAPKYFFSGQRGCGKSTELNRLEADAEITKKFFVVKYSVKEVCDVNNPSLEKSLREQGLQIVSVDVGDHKDLPAYFSSINSTNTVFFLHDMDKGFPDVLQYLNFKREDLVEHKVKVVFWVREEELASIGAQAPDFFAFRNCVVEFMEVPVVEERKPALVKFALETEYKSWDESSAI